MGVLLALFFLAELSSRYLEKRVPSVPHWNVVRAMTDVILLRRRTSTWVISSSHSPSSHYTNSPAYILWSSPNSTPMAPSMGTQTRRC
ncbi:hypothetical protein BJY00DRAFT_289267 [Aspergillus carlsbadensis]|nr:hypothetical protein BJY00DRAFT_289267 [Aspergillus carlsbadensis]